MKIFEDTFDAFEEKEIIDFLKDKTPTDSKIKMERVDEECGWMYIKMKNGERDFSINYSAVMMDTSILIAFFASIVDLKDDMVLFLDYEGSFPMLYAAPIDNKAIRFLFAHDYELFLNDEINEYNLNDYKVEVDVIVDKKELLAEFYNAFQLFTKNYDIKKALEQTFDLKKGRKYLEKIEKYLKQ